MHKPFHLSRRMACFFAVVTVVVRIDWEIATLPEWFEDNPFMIIRKHQKEWRQF